MTVAGVTRSFSNAAILHMLTSEDVKVPLTPLTRAGHTLQQAASEKRQGTKSRELGYGARRRLLRSGQ